MRMKITPYIACVILEQNLSREVPAWAYEWARQIVDEAVNDAQFDT